MIHYQMEEIPHSIALKLKITHHNEGDDIYSNRDVNHLFYGLRQLVKGTVKVFVYRELQR